MTHTFPGRTYLYFAAQSINLTAAVMSVTMAAVVGSALAPTATLSTVPYGFQFLFLMLATYPASKLMSRFGRKKAFMLGATPLAVSGLCGFWAVEHLDFTMLVASHASLGIYIAIANFNRFAATDNLDQTLKPKAVSLVIAGGVVAALAGPTLTELLRDIGGYSLFSLCYASFLGLAALSLSVAACLPKDGVAPISHKEKVATRRQITLSPPISIAIAVAALGYGIMNLLMIQASMHMKHMHEEFSDIRLAIQWHVIAMFAPSFFTGTIINRLGIKTTICLGLAMLIACAAVNIGSSNYAAVNLSLIILGLGWNLTYVGGSALLAATLQNQPNAIHMQGKNDAIIVIFATAGAFTPSFLFDTAGWVLTNTICIIPCVILLFFTISMLDGKSGSTQSLEGANN